MDIKIKTTAKTTSRVLEAIIGQHLVPGDGINLSDGSGTFVTLHTRDAVKRILDNFFVIPKPNNEFKLTSSNESAT